MSLSAPDVLLIIQLCMFWISQDYSTAIQSTCFLNPFVRLLLGVALFVVMISRVDEIYLDTLWQVAPGYIFRTRRRASEKVDHKLVCYPCVEGTVQREFVRYPSQRYVEPVDITCEIACDLVMAYVDVQTQLPVTLAC